MRFHYNMVNVVRGDVYWMNPLEQLGKLHTNFTYYFSIVKTFSVSGKWNAKIIF